MKIQLQSLQLVSFAGIALGSFASDAQAAAFVPFGVQQNVSYTTVTDTWGWSLIYQGTYNQTVAISTVFTGVRSGDYIMYAAREVGSGTIALLAAAPEADVRRVTARNQTTSSNGVEWYYNGGSIGFAGAGQTILQNSADVNSTGNFGGSTDPFGATRLSWHSSGGYGNQPTFLNGGWRAGITAFLNESTSWERLVFVAPIPEPSSAAALLGASALGFAALRRRRR